MKIRLLLPVMAILLFQTLSADDGQFYIKAESGASFSAKSKVRAPLPIWDEAVQGYDDNLGTVGIFGGAIGYEFPCVVSLEAEVSYRPNFQYKKYQIGIDQNNPGFLGDKTRRFDLDILTGMINVYFSGKGMPYLDWNCGTFPFHVYPLVGVGVGYNQLKITNFRSTGLPTLGASCAGNNPNFSPSFASENNFTERYRFAYQLMGGIEARFCDVWAISVGYRWFDAGSFKGPRYFRNACGFALDLPPWKIDFKANEVFVELKVFL